MNLKAKIEVIEDYQSSSQFTLWADIKQGDILRISMPFKKLARNNGRLHSPEVIVLNLRNNIKFTGSLNVVLNYLKKICYVEVP